MLKRLRYVSFPILPLRADHARAPRVYCDPGEQGSVFFITKDGVFLTAKHVVNKWSVDSYTVIALDFRQGGKKHCAVLALERHPEMDVAIGRADQPGPYGWPCPVTLSGSRVRDGA